MTKNEIRKWAMERGFYSHYSGNQKRFFFTPTGFGMDINKLINLKISKP